MTLDQPPCLIDKISELTSLSSVSAATPAQVTSNIAVVPIQCKEIYKQMTLDVNTERENTKKSIGDFVNKHLFKRLKFHNLELLIYETKKSSICQKVCNHLNMAEGSRVSFWNTYILCVENAIRLARNDAVQAMKSSFLGGKSVTQNTC